MTPFQKSSRMTLEKWSALMRDIGPVAHKMFRRWNEKMGTMKTEHLYKIGDRFVTVDVPQALPYRHDGGMVDVDQEFINMCNKQLTFFIFLK